MSPPEVTADAIVAEIDRVVDDRPVETDGAARAAELIAPPGLSAGAGGGLGP